MSVGVNIEKIGNLKLDLLTYIETVNSLYTEYENCKLSIISSIEGPGKEDITKKLTTLGDELVKIKSILDSYITTLNKIVKEYEQQDSNLSSNLQDSIDKLYEEV